MNKTITTISTLLLATLIGCSRPPIETLHTRIGTASPPDKDGSTIYYGCDIDVTVNNQLGSIDIMYSNFYPPHANQHMSTLETRAAEVIEAYFPHLGDIHTQKNLRGNKL